MIIRLPGNRHFEAYWLSNSGWRWRLRRTFDSRFFWAYWGRFAIGWSVPRSR